MFPAHRIRVRHKASSWWSGILDTKHATCLFNYKKEVSNSFTWWVPVQQMQKAFSCGSEMFCTTGFWKDAFGFLFGHNAQAVVVRDMLQQSYLGLTTIPLRMSGARCVYNKRRRTGWPSRRETRERFWIAEWGWRISVSVLSNSDRCWSLPQSQTITWFRKHQRPIAIHEREVQNEMGWTWWNYRLDIA